MVEALLNFLTEYKVADICIGLVGLFGFGLIFDRFKSLFFDYALPAEPFMKQVMTLVENEKVDEAITFCAANEKKPLAFVIKRVLERADRDERSIEHSLDIAASEIAPKLVKNLGHLAMVANVVTLVGLFGTVVGLITAFKALSFADVSQKQTILAQGISIAMSATAMGLMVAIPTMVIYSFLHAKQGKLFSEVDQYAQKVIELLRERTYVPFKTGNAFPTHLEADMLAQKSTKAPPVPKAS